MNKVGKIRIAIVGALLALYGAGAAAQAVNEVEPNYPVAQSVALGADGTIVIKGIVGVMFGAPVPDADLYAFHANEGDVMDLDIDGGRKNGTTGRDVWTVLTLFGPAPDYRVERQVLMTELTEIDEGSISIFDPYISKFRAATSGTHIVAVTGYPVFPTDGGFVSGAPMYNGDYTLIISGATEKPAPPPPPPAAPSAPESAPAPVAQQINIEIKPGSRQFAPFNPNSKGNIPVALLSSGEFEALEVEVSSLTFGATGYEQSVRKCDKNGRDVNHDGKLDLVCHVDTQAANFGPNHTEGVLKGTIGGRPFEGRSVLKVIPPVKKQK